MQSKAFVFGIVVWAGALSALAAMGAVAQRPGASSAAVLTLYNVAAARNIESGDISFSSISTAAAAQIEKWAHQHGVPLRTYVFNGRGYTVVYSGRSYDCFRYPTGRGHYIICVRDDGTLLGAIAVSDSVAEPPQ
ncbi:MAG TPA: hypothetical protein VGZ02_13085 [Candidatus Baltobacteraceae bacterium]|jgi:hypothetical protein|nr:hypothetical protein [Candidatus Baltobacteraceae bacterium]